MKFVYLGVVCFSLVGASLKAPNDAAANALLAWNDLVSCYNSLMGRADTTSLLNAQSLLSLMDEAASRLREEDLKAISRGESFKQVRWSIEREAQRRGIVLEKAPTKEVDPLGKWDAAVQSYLEIVLHRARESSEMDKIFALTSCEDAAQSLTSLDLEHLLLTVENEEVLEVVKSAADHKMRAAQVQSLLNARGAADIATAMKAWSTEAHQMSANQAKNLLSSRHVADISAAMKTWKSAAKDYAIADQDVYYVEETCEIALQNLTPAELKQVLARSNPDDPLWPMIKKEAESRFGQLSVSRMIKLNLQLTPTG